MAKQTHLLNRKGHYYFRIAIPQDLQPRFGKRELGASLKTTNYKNASLKCAMLTSRTYNLFELVRGNLLLDTQDIREMVRHYFKEVISAMEVCKQQELTPPYTSEEGQRIQKSMREIREVSQEVLFNSDIQGNPVNNHRFLTPSDTEFKVSIEIITDFLIQSNNLDISKNSHDYIALRAAGKRLFESINQYHLNLLTGNLEKDIEDEWFKDLHPNYSLPSQEKVIEAKAITLSEALKEYLEASNAKADSLNKQRTGVDWFIAWFGDISINLVTKKIAREFLSNLDKMPKHSNKKYKDISPAELIKRKYGRDEHLATNTKKHYLAAMKSIFQWSKDSLDGNLLSENPFERLTVKTDKKAVDERDPFSNQQLAKIFSSPIYTGSGNTTHTRLKTGEHVIKDAHYWVPLIGLFTGARLGEICQLTPKDVYQTEGIWVLSINEEGDKSVKTKSSIRITPVHKKLIELGFLEYLSRMQKNKAKQLFPTLKQSKSGSLSKNFSKQFSRMLVKIDAKTPLTCFHSFRHNIKNALRQVDTPHEVNDSITGHSISGMAGRYGTGEPLPRMNKYLNMVTYDCIDWEKIK